MRVFKPNPERGDTIIEVLLALAIVSAVAVGVVAVMNRSMNKALASTEASQVRQFLVQQSELLTYIRDSYAQADAAGRSEPPASLWKDLKDDYDTSATSEGLKDPCTPADNKAFYINASKLNKLTVTKYAHGASYTPPSIAKPGNGLWVNAVFSRAAAPGVPRYVDLYIKACWSPLGSGPNQQLRTVTRLYDALD